jgi:hypothetical protein
MLTTETELLTPNRDYEIPDSYFALLRRRRIEAVDSLCDYRAGKLKTLALARGDGYDVQILTNRRIFYWRDGEPNPAPAGKWLDVPEFHWGLNRQEYYGLDEKDRAELEAKEQLRYVAIEFDPLFQTFYFPERCYIEEGQ